MGMYQPVNYALDALQGFKGVQDIMSQQAQDERLKQQAQMQQESHTLDVKQKGLEIDSKQLALDEARRKVARSVEAELLNKKLRMLDEDDDALMKMSMKDLATAFGILFDKAQLAQGLSTENIAIHTKIDVNLSSEEALDELTRLREAITQQNS